MRRPAYLLLLTILLISAFSFSEQKPAGLTFVWHAGPLGEFLTELSRDYTAKTGVAVRSELVPWGEWHDRIGREFESKGSSIDLTIFDSQSMSEFASKEHVVLLNPFMEKSKSIHVSDFDPAALRQYGEYPEGSGKFYALPVNQDVMGLAYRKDLLENPEEKKAFQAKYGYELAVPSTYDQLKDIAEFFTRPDKDLYGIALYGSEEYDGVTSQFNNVLWSFGGELWDAKARKAAGNINSDLAVSALEYYASLFQYAPPGASGWFYNEVTNALHSGRVALAMNWYYFFGSHADPKVNRLADNIGFAPLPGRKGADGQFRQFHSVGGQGISISRYSKNVEEAWKFLEWFMSKEIQWKWVRGGAQTGRLDILKSSEYAAATAFNRSFEQSMSRVKDYWHLVEYPQLLKSYQKYTHKVVAGEMKPKEALDRVAEEHQAILDGKL